MDVAEGKQKQSQEQLEGITQQVRELQSKCSMIKAEVQRSYSNLKSSEVCVWTLKRHNMNIMTVCIMLYIEIVYPCR